MTEISVPIKCLEFNSFLHKSCAERPQTVDQRCNLPRLSLSLSTVYSYTHTPHVRNRYLQTIKTSKKILTKWCVPASCFCLHVPGTFLVSTVVDGDQQSKILLAGEFKMKWKKKRVLAFSRLPNTLSSFFHFFSISPAGRILFSWSSRRYTGSWPAKTKKKKEKEKKVISLNLFKVQNFSFNVSNF